MTNSAKAFDRSRDPTVVLSALEDLVACYQRLDELAAEQSGHVNSGDTERLLEVLQKRQEYAKRSTERDRELAEVKGDWPGASSHWHEAERSRALKLFGQVRRFLETITSRDTQDMLSLGEQRLRVRTHRNEGHAEERVVRQINRHYVAAAYREFEQQRIGRLAEERE